MICPYNRKRQTTVLQWTQSNGDEGVTDLQQIEKVDFCMMECPKEGCAVWHNGRCCYAIVNLDNEL